MSSDDDRREVCSTFNRLGHEYDIGTADEHLVFADCRLKVLDGIEVASQCVHLDLNTNFIEDMEPVKALSRLEYLDLYLNKIRRIQGLEGMKELSFLDLSFNAVRKIDGLDAVTKLESLYLPSNKIEVIQNVDHLTNLVCLELAANRIRNVTGIESLCKLEQLWLGKNKLTKMLVPPLPSLRQLALQSNRIGEWDHCIEHLPALEELYLGHNQLPSPPRGLLSKVPKLTVLDLAGNAVDSLEWLEDTLELKDLWLNDNKIADRKQIHYITSTKLETVYLERNPMQLQLGPAYRGLVIELAPQLQQLDALEVTSVRQ
ncbi:MAG: hypothetical protein KVP17_000200 [Porospora cf. gigantea B]|uniref:uncharacterized protein n=1 Tax=Porospora cf. gigantea B TaxID=2853592 RepID=UPI003571C03E|nr:MAG: hypothetical protein KVP17_000200 [Porospora cf. gigantea B]